LIVFAFGIAIGAAMARGFDTTLYRGKQPKEAGRALLELGRKQAGKGAGSASASAASTTSPA